MIKFLIFVFINTILAYNIMAQQKLQEVFFQIKIPANESINFYVDGGNTMLFRNKHSHDTCITKSFNFSKPSILRYTKLVINEDSHTPLVFRFLVSNQDTIYLSKRQNKIIALNTLNSSVLLDDWLKLSSVFDFSTSQLKFFDKSKLNVYDSKIKSIFSKNQKTIDSLHKQKLINSNTQKYWSLINEQDFLFHQLELVNKINSTNDSLFQYIFERMSDLIQIESDTLFDLITELCDYDLRKSHKDLKSKIERISFYLKYQSVLQNISTVIIQNLLDLYTDKNSAEFIKASKLVKQKLNEQQVTLFNQQQFIEMLKTDSVASPSNDSANLFEVFARTQRKYVFVDLWAHWCAPCIAEIPYLEKWKQEYKNKDIAFVSISLDIAEDRQKWLGAIKKHHLENDKFQYILLNPKKNTFTQQLRVNSIPRFLVIQSDGKLINSFFVRPSDPNFQKELDAVLMK